ncbi:MAG: TIGR01244 family sulfur transferase [Pseudohongiellaceae bacterium]
MKSTTINDQLSISDQLQLEDIEELVKLDVEHLVCNRPDGEAESQIKFEIIEAEAKAQGLTVSFLPFKSGHLTTDIVDQFSAMIKEGKKTHAYCRTGNRCFNLHAASLASMGTPKSEIISAAQAIGIDVSASIKPYFGDSESEKSVIGDTKSEAKPSYEVLIIGGGSGGIALASSLLKRDSDLRIAIVDPAEKHYYQPGWTMVGGGVFDASSTCKELKDLIPRSVTWIKKSVISFDPAQNEISVEDGSVIHYQQLVVCPGLALNWEGVKGLKETLGSNGVTSNYDYKLAPYTWELVKGLKNGKAIFTQPPMPIKCAGAPQKALYLSCDHWLRTNVLQNLDVDFFNAGPVLFGVSDYVPALQSYIDKYSANVHYSQNLVEVDGANKTATFKDAEGNLSVQNFDMLHVCPPQQSPKFVADSALADQSGWLDVDQYTLRHTKFDNVWGLGDVMNTPNAKTMAAVRKQVPVVAQNICDVMAKAEPSKGYDGYGSCPLTVERGKIVLAEFGYGGKLLPSFPAWLLQGKKPTKAAWILKASMLPWIYWQAMLKGREWLAKPKSLTSVKP